MNNNDIYKLERIESEIKHKVSFIINKYINDIRLKNITILRAKLYKDFSVIKIFIFSLNEFIDNNKMKILNNASNFIRKKISKLLYIKYIPKIIFINDIHIKKSFNILNIINNIK